MKNKIVLVPFPFDDFSSIKVRPALCLTNAIGEFNHVIIAFISSRISAATEPSDIILSESHKYFSKTGLKTTSVIRLHRLITIPSGIIKRELGSISTSHHTEMNNKLKQLFKLK